MVHAMKSTLKDKAELILLNKPDHSDQCKRLKSE